MKATRSRLPTTKTAHRGTTCQNGKSLEEQSMYGKTSGKMEEFCSDNACKRAHCEYISSHYQQSSCEDCNNCKPRCRTRSQEGVNGRHQEHSKMAEHCTKICKKVHSEYISSHYQQSNYESCESCNNCKPRRRICSREEAKGRQKVHNEYIRFHYQQSSCEDYKPRCRTPSQEGINGRHQK